MEKIKAKRRRFNALLHVGKLIDAKPHLLAGFGVGSTLDLTEPQLDQLINRVEELVDKKRIDADREIRDMRHKCLRMIQKCGVDTSDWNKVNAFMLSKRIAGKHLYELTLEEMKVLHRKLQNVSENIHLKNDRIERITKMN